MATKEDYDIKIKELTNLFNERKSALETQYSQKMKELETREKSILSKEDEISKKTLELENQIKEGVEKKKSELLELWKNENETEFAQFKNQIAETQLKLDSQMKSYVVKNAEWQQKEIELNNREQKILQKENDAVKDFIGKKAEESIAFAKKLAEMTDSFKNQMDAILDATNQKNTNLSNKFIEYLNSKVEKSEEYHQKYLQTYTEKLAGVKDEIEKEKQSEIAKMNQEIETQRKNNEALLESELNARRNSVKIREEEVTEREKKCTQKEAQIAAMENAFYSEKTRIEGIANQADERENRLAQHEEELQKREAQLDEIVEMRSKKLAEQRIINLQNEIEYYKEQLGSQMSQKALLDRLEQIQAEWGDDPQILIAKMNDYKARLDNAILELNKRPQEVVEEYKKLKDRLDEIVLRETNLDGLEKENAELKAKNAQLLSLPSEIDTKETIIKQKEKEIERLKGIYKDEATRNERIANITTPLPQFSFEKTGGWKKIDKDTKLKYLGDNEKIINDDGTYDENKWLKNISAGCKAHDIIFNPRVLKAFHTALKTSELSPLTVLAGVSGTGKSELPRLYASFGGLPFTGIAVQPNWDSPESMLGYFNSIDNNFEAKDVLRLLVQADGSYSGNSSLNNFMSLILLDEMNLSNVELYFSDFLSKLESRRGCEIGKEPFIDIKIGSGMEPFPLKLGRNVLWTGTMNQDETTKTLSDKVLDRGIVINFPSPHNLKTRKNVSKPLPENKEFLTRRIWNSWIRREINFTNEEIGKYKTITENINKHLNLTGRALGHRVWQSIEYYMANYPDVIVAQQNKDKNQLARAMNTAFEDQLVQKIMPKLRGLETNSEVQANAIQAIRNELETAGKTLLNDEQRMNKILKDYDNAKNSNYGSFMWCTSDYLNDEEGEKN